MLRVLLHYLAGGKAGENRRRRRPVHHGVPATIAALNLLTRPKYRSAIVIISSIEDQDLYLPP